MNSVKQIARDQYKAIVNKAAEQIRGLSHPKEGWISIARNALGMSVTQLARRLNVSRNHISKTEKAELSGAVTIKTMEKIAQGMGCRFVYAIVPEKTVEDILEYRAMEKARHVVETTSKHMALEGQALSPKQIALEIKRIQKMLLDDISPDFWNDDGEP